MAVKKQIKKRKTPYTKRSLQEQMETNLKKTKRLLDNKEYSTSIIRGVTALDLYTTGLIKKKLLEKLSQNLTDDILKKYKSIPVKLTFLLKECYGFSAADRFSEQYNQISKALETRNKIVHEGRFSNKSTAEKIVQNIDELISNIRNEIVERGFEL